MTAQPLEASPGRRMQALLYQLQCQYPNRWSDCRRGRHLAHRDQAISIVRLWNRTKVAPWIDEALMFTAN
jgi:hypothetical protein